jgi:hypothetical protein
MQREVSRSGPINPTKRASWIVRVTQTNQYNWILLVVMGSAAGVVGVLGLIAGKCARWLDRPALRSYHSRTERLVGATGHPDTGNRVAA